MIVVITLMGLGRLYLAMITFIVNFEVAGINLMMGIQLPLKTDMCSLFSFGTIGFFFEA